MIEVYRGSNYIEAQILLGRMRASGIDAYLQGELQHGGIGELPVLGHLAIFVNEDDHLPALDLVRAYDNGDLALEDES